MQLYQDKNTSDIGTMDRPIIFQQLYAVLGKAFIKTWIMFINDKIKRKSLAKQNKAF